MSTSFLCFCCLASDRREIVLSTTLAWSSRQHYPKVDLGFFSAISFVPLSHGESNPNTKPIKYLWLKNYVVLPFLMCKENAPTKDNDKIPHQLHILPLLLITPNLSVFHPCRICFNAASNEIFPYFDYFRVLPLMWKLPK